MDKLLTKYWFKFDEVSENLLMQAGVGVTAYSYDDAISLIKSEFYKDNTMPPVKSFIENINVTTLDANHILSNLGPVNLRGIWYPFMNLR